MGNIADGVTVSDTMQDEGDFLVDLVHLNPDCTISQLNTPTSEYQLVVQRVLLFVW